MLRGRGGGAFRGYSPAEAAAALPGWANSRAVDSVRLASVVSAALAERPGRAPSAFRVEALLALRQWAKRRHVYGSRFGFPGGSAWMAMLLVYCQWYDAVVLCEAVPGRQREDVLWHLLLTVALWPWPLPFTLANVRALGGRRAALCAAGVGGETLVGGRVLEGSVGRRLVTSFVVPLPCEGSTWNMTQAVQWPNHLCLLRDAWDAGLRRVRVGDPPLVSDDLVAETAWRAAASQWPLFLVARVPRPAGAPPGWVSLVTNRLVSTVWPQLDACGFFARPLCSDDPFVFLLWPQECVWSRHCRADLVLPLRRRVGNALFHMVVEAHRSLWPAGVPAPELSELMPVLTLTRRLPLEPATQGR